MNESFSGKYGLSGDLGWNELNEGKTWPLHTLLLLTTTGAYFAATWLLSGLAPVSVLAHRRGQSRPISTQSHHE